MDIVEALDGPHEWGYRGVAGEGFIHDPAPNNAAREIQKLRAEAEALRPALEVLRELHTLIDFEEPLSDTTPWLFENPTDINAAFEKAYEVIRAARARDGLSEPEEK